MNDNLSNLIAISFCKQIKRDLQGLIDKIDRAEHDAVLLQAAELRSQLADLVENISVIASYVETGDI